jgi:tRNA A-37 threonylcarbamoyl transferase component Bud32
MEEDKEIISLKKIILITTKFVSKNYKNPEVTIQLLQNFMKDDINKVIKVFESSSSKSLIFLSNDNVYKLMDISNSYIDDKTILNIDSDNNKLIEYNKEAIPLKLNCEESFTICVKDILISANINVIKYEKLKIINHPKKLKYILLLLYQVAIALKNIHDIGYFHNDVYFSNIGVRDKNNYILYDFELGDLLDEKNHNEQMYNDVKMFLEDLQKFYTEPIASFIKNILNYLNQKYVVDTGRTKKILRREYKIYKYTYEKNSFTKLLRKLVNQYSQNNKIEDLNKYLNKLK